MATNESFHTPCAAQMFMTRAICRCGAFWSARIMHGKSGPNFALRSRIFAASIWSVRVMFESETRPVLATSIVSWDGGSSSCVSTMPWLPSSSLMVVSLSSVIFRVTTKKMISWNTTSIIGVMSSEASS